MTNHPIHPPPDPPLVHDLLQYVLLISEAEHLLAGDMPLISCLHRGKKSGKNCFKSSRKNLAIKKKHQEKLYLFFHSSLSSKRFLSRSRFGFVFCSCLRLKNPKQKRLNAAIYTSCWSSIWGLHWWHAKCCNLLQNVELVSKKNASHYNKVVYLVLSLDCPVAILLLNFVLLWSFLFGFTTFFLFSSSCFSLVTCFLLSFLGTGFG